MKMILLWGGLAYLSSMIILWKDKGQITVGNVKWKEREQEDVSVLMRRPSLCACPLLLIFCCSINDREARINEMLKECSLAINY